MAKGLLRASFRALLWGALISGCGYRPLYSETPPEDRLSVVASSVAITRAGAVQAALRGARQELAVAKALSTSSDRHPRLVIEVVRIDEVATGIVAVEGSTGLAPLARGSRVAVTGRAWIELRRGGPRTAETADLRRVEFVASGASAGVDSRINRSAVEAAANRLGRDLARAVMGLPTPRRDGP